MLEIVFDWFRYRYLIIYTLMFIAIAFNLDNTNCVNAKYIQGQVETSEDWIFLTRFCFYSQSGLFKYDIEYPINYAVQKILLYYDSPTQWPTIYKKQKTCEQKESVLSRENRQIVNLSVDFDFAGCREVDDIRLGGGRSLSCSGERRFETARERWWFVAISNCNSSKGLKFSYKITMTNGDLGDFRYAHFSADEFKILEMSFGFLVLHGVLLAMSCCSAVILHQRHLLHTTFKIYLISLVTYCFALLLNSLAYSQYSNDGVGLPLTKLWGQVLQTISLTEFLLLLLLLAKGYTVTRARLRPISALKLIIFMVIYSITNILLFIYKEEVFDPGEVLYLYESPPGYGLITLRLISWGMFIYAIIFTLKHYPEKGAFYYPFLAFFTMWFLAGPILILAANFVIDKWVREKVLYGTEVSVSFLAFVIFWCMTLPTITNINFPYHVRTTQIGVCGSHRQNSGSSSDDSDGRNLDAFVHHNYAPTAPPFTPDRTDRIIYDVFFVGSGSVGVNNGQGPIIATAATVHAVDSTSPQHGRRAPQPPPPILATGRTVHPQLWSHLQDVAAVNSNRQHSRPNKNDEGVYDEDLPPPYYSTENYRRRQSADNFTDNHRPSHEQHESNDITATHGH